MESCSTPQATLQTPLPTGLRSPARIKPHSAHRPSVAPHCLDTEVQALQCPPQFRIHQVQPSQVHCVCPRPWICSLQESHPLNAVPCFPVTSTSTQTLLLPQWLNSPCFSSSAHEEELSAAPELTSLQSPLFGGLRLQISIPDILGSAHHHTLCPCGTLDGYTALVSLSDTWPNTSSSSCDGCEV